MKLNQKSLVSLNNSMKNQSIINPDTEEINNYKDYNLEEDNVKILISKLKFLNNYVYQAKANENRGFMNQVAIYKLVTCDFPIILNGKVDKNPKFRLVQF